MNHQLATAEEPPANESKEELTKKLEYSASLEVQQQNRPLAKLQKHLHDQKLLVDDDDELYYLMGTLSNIHKTYYDMLSQQNEPEPNLMEIIPSLKQKSSKIAILFFRINTPRDRYSKVGHSDMDEYIWCHFHSRYRLPDDTFNHQEP